MRDVRRRLHQRELGCRLDHPAAADDRVGADSAQRRDLLPEPIEDEIAVGLFEADWRPRDPAFAQEIGNQFQRLLIFIPGPDFGRDRQAFGDRWSLEEGSDDDRLALRGDDRRGQALRPPPLNPSEIVEACARFDDDRADAVPLHQTPGLWPGAAFAPPGRSAAESGSEGSSSAACAITRLSGNVMAAAAAPAP